MQLFKLYLLFVLLVSPISVFAEPSSTHALGAHVHGVATLQVAVDNKALMINFSSPLDNLLGFEHKARNQAEMKKVKQMVNQFNKANLFVPTPSAKCKLDHVDLQSPVIHKVGATPQHEEATGHSDLDAEFHYTCQNVKDLRDLEVRLFKAFAHLHRVNVEIVSDRGQTATQLSPNNDQATW